MARFIQKYRLEEPQDRNYSRVFRYLSGKGYIVSQYKGSTVFRKEGNPLLGYCTMVQLNYAGDVVQLEAWVKGTHVTDDLSGELGIGGFYGIALKGELKQIVVELDWLLGGAAQRIGNNDYLRWKGRSFNRSTARVNPEVRTYGTAPDQTARKPEPVHAPRQPEFTREAPVPRSTPVQKAPEPNVPPVRKEEKPAAPKQPEPDRREPDIPLDVNTCTQSQLLTLPGVTVAQAKRALEYREAQGGFRSADEFVEVLELKPHFVVQILPKITVSAPQPRPEEEDDKEPSVRRVFDI